MTNEGQEARRESRIVECRLANVPNFKAHGQSKKQCSGKQLPLILVEHRTPPLPLYSLLSSRVQQLQYDVQLRVVL